MPALLVGTYCEDGTPNAMTAAWAAACCHRPPCVGVAVRHNRLTFANLQKQKVFTINVPRSTQAAQVDYLGMVSGMDKPNKLEVAGFEVEKGQKVNAPIITGCPVNLECKLVDRLALGSHSWFAGEIVEVHVDEQFVKENNRIDVTALDPLIYATTASEYHTLGKTVATAYSAGRQLMKD
jgi:flavin reductase (DIM6/NTAB) family NADH-FMN oxidoreductase RutF